MQPAVSSTDLTKATVTVAEVSDYVTSHIKVNGSTTPTITNVELLPVSSVNTRIGGGIQGPGDALVYVVRVQGPITIDASMATITGPYEELIFSAATGNYLGRHVPPS